MKRENLIIPALALLMGLGGCKNDDQPTATTSYSLPVVNLITPLDGESAPYAAAGNYRFTYDLYAQTVLVEGSDIMIDNNAVAFSAGPVRYFHNTTDINYSSENGNEFEATPWNVKDLGFMISERVIRIATPFPGITGLTTASPRLAMTYRLGDKYSVSTFMPETFYKGETTTSFPNRTTGDTETFQTDGISYRVVIDLKERKADVVMYEAQFAPKAPKLAAIGLKGLDVTYQAGAYTVSGTDIIPLLPEGSSTTPNPAFIFNTFTLRTTDADLTEVKADFQVAGVYKGTFTGSCLSE